MQNNLAIKVTKLSKKYSIGKNENNLTLAERLRYLFRKKKNQDNNEEFYALKNICFDIKKGEVVGIIGRNGAGKSTLLKILSRVTEPSEGKVEIYGTVASVLEVGMGFHPELTGRENVYLSGAMLGIPKKQIEEKFNEIFTFAGVEEFIDTPVKHYSSGMYVRLAFSVVTNIDADILLFDEVLSVGDMAFQMKCAKRIIELTNKQRTILLVSHSMKEIQHLCRKVIYMDKGKIEQHGNIDIIKDYFEDTLINNYNGNKNKKKLFENVLIMDWTKSNKVIGDESIRINKFFIVNESNLNETKFYTNDLISINVEYEKYDDENYFDIGIVISNMGNMFMGCHTYLSDLNISAFKKRGSYNAKVFIDKHFFNDTILSIGYSIGKNNEKIICYDRDVLQLKIFQGKISNKIEYFESFSEFTGPLRPKMHWEISSRKKS